MYLEIQPIKTDRLIIRKTSAYDVDLLLKMDCQEITQKYLGGIKHKSREERITFLETRDSSYTICLKDGTAIGFVEIKNSAEKGTASLSYIFDHDYWNKGYCTESCKELIDIYFRNKEIRHICADTISENIGSKRVLEKLGFDLIGSKNKGENNFLEYKLVNKHYVLRR